MRHIEFTPNAKYDVALLIKPPQLVETQLRQYYIKPLENKGLSNDRIIAFDVDTNPKGKVTATIAKAYLKKALKALDNLGVTTIFVCDAMYFKTLTKEGKADPHYGYVLQCAIDGYTHMDIVLGVNYSAIYYNPKLSDKLDLAIATLANKTTGIYTPVGSSIIKSAYYPTDFNQIKAAINNLHTHKVLTCDIETFSLNFWEAGIGTIAFAWNQHEGVAFSVDHVTPKGWLEARQKENKGVKELLRKFFDMYKGTIIYHNATFDIKILIYELYMTHSLDNKNLLYGIEQLTKNIEDTKLITYLATNATIGNNLSLKDNAHEFAGNYAEEDINDITKIAKKELLEYNLVDCLSTWYTYNKYWDQMCNDNQLDVYREIMMPSVKVILQQELVGMPLDMVRVIDVKKELEDTQRIAKNILTSEPLIADFTDQLRKEEMIMKNLLLKVKVKPIEDFNYLRFNPASTKHLRKLFYEFMGYDVIDKTKTGLPATGAKTIAKLKNRVTDPDHEIIFDALIDLAEVSIILNTFIHAFEHKSFKKEDGRWYLHGNFNLGGTVSGRLSSSKPNMQNIPSTGTKYAKAIKSCFVAPEGWLLAGADFFSLEDKISALTTRDPNKMKVYTDGYDGHCLRAFSYFGSEMDQIRDTVQSINSISKTYPELRQKSKGPTFLLTYGGTAYGLINTIGLQPKIAHQIEENYHKLYKVSDDWVKDKIEKATHDGYVTLAFGLRLRTPILAQTLLNKKTTPMQSKSEARTAGNALGQSYGMLNNRAGIEFQGRVLRSKHRLDILPIAQVHDSQYFLIKNNLGCLKWLNDNLVECMEWQGLPEIQHPVVKLGGEVEVYYPDWSITHTIPNSVTKQEIIDIVK